MKLKLEQLKGVAAIPPGSAERGTKGGPELISKDLETFRKAGWRFVKTDEYDPDDPELALAHLTEVPREAEQPAQIEESLSAPQAPNLRRVYRNAAGQLVIEGSSIVAKFQPSVPHPRVVELLDAYGLEVQSRLGFVKNGFQVRLKQSNEQDLVEIADRLDEEPDIDYAEPVTIERIETR